MKFLLSEENLHRMWMVACLLTIIHVALFDTRTITAPEALQVQCIPDDGFYYLGLARHFSESHCWTSDNGVSQTTGFHPLYAYLLAAIHQVLGPSTETFVIYALIMNALIVFLASMLVWTIGKHQRTPYLLIMGSLLISSTNYAYNSASTMEWPLVVLFSVLYITYFHHSFSVKPPPIQSSLLLFGIGTLGSLSRSDFGLLPFSLCVASLLWRRAAGRIIVVRSIAGLAGASLGLVLILIHNYAISGSVLQSSARMKAHWGRVTGISYENTIRAIYDMLFDFRTDQLAFLALLTLITLACLVVRIRSHCSSTPEIGDKRNPAGVVISTAAVICAVGYVVVYARNSAGLQPWYSANLVAPVYILLVAMTHLTDSTIPRAWRLRFMLCISLLASITVARNVVELHRYFPWPNLRHQITMLEAGRYLATHALGGRVASWNSGIIGYYQGGQVINIDGLVNDDIYAYAIRNDLRSYLVERHIDYIIDFENMILDRNHVIRGGYADELFMDSLRPIKVFDGPTGGWQHMTLYRFSNGGAPDLPPCSAKTPR